MAIAPAFYRHEFKQGADYSVELDLRDPNGLIIDTTGWTGISPINTVDGVSPVDASNNPIALAVEFPVSGTFRLSLTPAQTAALTPRRYIADTKLLDASGTPAYYLDGDVIVRRSYTP